MATKQELQALYEQLSQQFTDESRIITDLIKNELERRKRAGRPAGNLTRKEQNRLAQQRFRDKGKRLVE